APPPSHSSPPRRSSDLTIIGVILILPPTRALLRTLLSAKLFKSVENLGVRFYDASPMAGQHDSYGSFGNPGGQSCRSYRADQPRSEEHTSELQSRFDLV